MVLKTYTHFEWPCSRPTSNPNVLNYRQLHELATPHPRTSEVLSSPPRNHYQRKTHHDQSEAITEHTMYIIHTITNTIRTIDLSHEEL